MVKQHTPDANSPTLTNTQYYTDFIYDNKGRLRFSQNAMQKVNVSYSYTKYDQLGRIIEAGESKELPDQLNAQKNNNDFPSTGYEKTITVYSLPASESPQPADQLSMQQRYVRNRVSYTYTDDDGLASTVIDRSYTWYSYDTHGNVEWMVTDIPGLGKKKIRYEYDLLSNKVTLLAVNEGQKDQFFHKYDYDTDNRLIAVYTSHDNMLWDCDARYEYYTHGPLKRAVLGNDKVQGEDFTYTIQGWLKGINHPSLDPTNDPGKDGNSGSTSAADVYGMALTYFKGDYSNISTTQFGSSDVFNPVPANNSGTDRNLYNGNISAWATNLNTGKGLVYEGISADQYIYDDLNRISGSIFNTNNGSSWEPQTDYSTAYTYDPNGNILTLNRNANSINGANPLMDRLHYSYYESTNKLSHVTDDVPDANWSEIDIDNQNAQNYTYDENGNLISDLKENISNIEWTVYGKIKKITKANGTVISYKYNSAGNRIQKSVQNPGGEVITTYYLLDTKGIILATYKSDKQPITGGYVETISLNEQPLYGSDRLGTKNESIALSRITTMDADGIPVIEELGVKHESGLDNWVVPLVSATNSAKADILMKQSDPTVSPVNGVFGQGNILQSTVAEDDKGEQQFSFIVLDNLNGKANAALILDKKGNLMPRVAGSSIIPPFAQAKGKSAIVQNVANSNLYHIYSIGTNSKLYRHVVNTLLPGNGSEEIPLGDVVSTNELLLSDADFIPSMALATIKTGDNRKNILYLVRKTSNSPANLQLEAYDISGNDPVRTLISSFPGSTNYTDIKLSPDGRYIAVAVSKGNQTGFFDYTGQGSDIFIYLLGTDYQSAVLINTINTGVNANEISLDFSSDGNFIYYTSVGAEDGYQLNRFAVNSSSIQSITSIGKEASIARAVNEKLYISAAGNTSLTEIAHNTSGIPDIRNINISSGGYQLTGILPSQPHVAISGEQQSIFTRYIGLKNYELKITWEM